MTFAERYVELLAAHAPVVDVGCGAGGLLAALREAGIESRGVDLDAGMVAEAQASGLDVVQGDGLSYLENQADGSLGAITAIHVIEHLVFADLCRFLDLAAAKLRPGGVLVCETPNPTALIVLGHSYILDPTHKWPLHPSLMTFLCERAGFADVDVRFHSPADFFAVPLLDEGVDAPPQVATINEALHRLNSVLFGPQEYAIVASTASDVKDTATMTAKSVQDSAEHAWRAVKVSLRRWWSRGEWEGKLAEPFHATVEWWEGGCTPPPPTERKRQLLHELWCQHRMGTAVETGTFVGDTTAFLAERCPRVITIELDPDLAARARARFEDQPGVTVVEGDSGALLGGLLHDLDEPALFWLDGHFSGPHEGIQTARGRTDTPLLEELKALADWKHAQGQRRPHRRCPTHRGR